MDMRAHRAREHNELAGDAERMAATHREARDHLVRSLRSEDPKFWSYGELATAVGCSKELIAHILREERPRP